MIQNKTSVEIIRPIAKSLGYSTKLLTSTGKYKRLLVSDGKKICIVNSSTFGLYPEMMRWQRSLFNNKTLTQEVLRHLGYKTIPSIPVQHKSYDSFSELYKAICSKIAGYPVIVKPETSFDGQGIGIAETNSMLRKHLKTLYKKKDNSLVQPILDHDEYRILIVNGEVEVVHTKQKNYVLGDGVKKLSKLLKEKNSKKTDTTFIKRQLKSSGYTLRSVLPKGEKFPYHLTGRSLLGGYYETDKIPRVVSVWAKKLAQDISTPTIGIDIFAPKGITETSKYIIIELNANPGLEYIWNRYKDQKKVSEVVTKILSHYFKK